MTRFDDDDDECWLEYPGHQWTLTSDHHPQPELIECDQEEWGCILGPDGEPISFEVDTPRVPFGFQVP